MIALERHVAKVHSMKAGQRKRDALETLRAHRVQVQQRLWMLTPIAVTNNRLRHEINRHRSWHYAQATAQPIFKWDHKIVERVGDILHSGGNENNIALDELRTYFPELQGTLTLKHMYVGMSRVTSGKGLRVLPYIDKHSSKQHIRSNECVRG